VTGLKQELSRPRRRTAIAIACAGLAAGLLATSFMAMAQDQSAATVKDVIFARKTVMSTVSDNFDQIEGMISTNKIDLADAHEHADTISVLFMAYPHLFPPASNQWKPNVDRDPGTDTYASPEVWTKFSDFYQRAAHASKTAYDMSRADKVDELKAGATELRATCNACHAAYLKTD
jgi:cytochrome c556